MSLATFQTALGQRILARSTHPPPDHSLTPGEKQSFTRLFDHPGFRLTAAIQRSWCEGRAARSAYLTLSCLELSHRKQLLDKWINLGGGANSFLLAESIAFLQFLKPQLVDHPHAFSLCSFEAAILQAQEAALDWQPLPPITSDTPIITGQHAALITFHADPQVLLTAVSQARPLPITTSEPCHLLIAPGISDQFRLADSHDLVLWNDLTVTSTIDHLLASGHSHVRISDFLEVGLAGPVGQLASPSPEVK